MTARRASPAFAALLLLALPTPSAAQPALDASRIRIDTFTYEVRYGGDELGTLRVSYGRTEAGDIRVREEVSGVLGNEVTTYVMTPDLRPVSARRKGRLARVSAALDLSYSEGRVTGEATVRADSARPGQKPGDTRRIRVDRELPPGALDPNMLIAALLASRLTPGDTLRYPIFRPGTGVIEARARVAAADSVEVPAGTFGAYRVELSTDQGDFELWVTREPPRTLVRQAFADRPVEVVLRAIGAEEPSAGAAEDTAVSDRGRAGGGRLPQRRLALPAPADALQEAVPVQAPGVQLTVLEGTGDPLQHSAPEAASGFPVHELGGGLGPGQGGGGTGTAGPVDEAEPRAALDAAALVAVDVRLQGAHGQRGEELFGHGDVRR